jgi:MATE family multidrug resistance protein
MFRDAWCHRPTHRRVWALAAPMILSNLSTPLVALVDTAVVGHLPHAHQLAAVAVGGGLYVLIVGLLSFLRMGTTGFAAQACGRGDGATLRQVLAQGLLLALLLALTLGMLAVPFSRFALSLMSPSAELDELTRDFLRIRLFGLPAVLAHYTLVGWLLGTGNARGALLMMLTTNVLNIGLSLCFVLGLDWQVVGAARAAVLAEWGGALLGLILVGGALRRFAGRLAWSRLLGWRNWQTMLAVNRDMFLRSLALQLVFFLLTVQGTRLGEVTVAANAVLLNGLLLSAYALDGLAHALEALCGQAIGARERIVLRRTLIVAGTWSLLLSLLFALFFQFAGPFFVRAQTSIPAVRATALQFLPYLTLLPLLAVWSYLLDGLFIGATRAREMRNAMLLALGMGLPLGWLLQGLGNHGLWLAFLAFMALRGLLLGAQAWNLSRHDRWFAHAGH